MQFAPYSCFINAGFWHRLSQLKLNELGLDDSPVNISGYYTNSNKDGLPCCLNFDHTAFDSVAESLPGMHSIEGILLNKNTIDDFKNCDKKKLLQAEGTKVWNIIRSKEVVDTPSLLSSLILLTFADLKKYVYYFWFAFPVFSLPEGVKETDPVLKLADRFAQAQIASLTTSYDTVFPKGATFFLVRENGVNSLEAFRLKDYDGKAEVFLAFSDPCTLPKNGGWPLRNLLAFACVHWAAMRPDWQVICWRDRRIMGTRSVEHSIVLSVHLQDLSHQETPLEVCGWQPNEKNRLGPRCVKLASSMDPLELAESAVSLNLKLMRWRLLPELDLEAVANARCLLLGAGTLGCNVARCLLGWGVRHITFVDNSKVSFSNPVRQCLFEFQDSVDGKFKAEAAAEALKRIFPHVKACGKVMSIPMPGHPVSEAERGAVVDSCQQISDLVKSHDAIFLLMDTRESRWLPTLLGCLYGKIVINAALGFDSYLVMRHGIRTPGEFTKPAKRLGCYYCSDVVAPKNSTRERTLDQQCTVSRPGTSMIGAALAVELFVTIIQHPLKAAAPSDSPAADDKDIPSPLGLVPHQIRGYLSHHETILPSCQSFNRCTACSDKVIKHFEEEGTDFLLNVFNQPNFLEDITGLTELHAETEIAEVWDFSDSESI